MNSIDVLDVIMIPLVRYLTITDIINLSHTCTNLNRLLHTSSEINHSFCTVNCLPFQQSWMHLMGYQILPPSQQLWSSIKSSDFRMVNFLINSNNIVDGISYAITVGNLDMVKMLVEYYMSDDDDGDDDVRNDGDDGDDDDGWDTDTNGKNWRLYDVDVSVSDEWNYNMTIVSIDTHLDVTQLLCDATQHSEIFQYLLSNHQSLTDNIDWDIIVKKLALSGNISCIRLLTNLTSAHYNTIASIASNDGNYQLCEYILLLATTSERVAANTSERLLATGSQTVAANTSEKQFDVDTCEMLLNAAYNNDRKIINLLISHGITDFTSIICDAIQTEDSDYHIMYREVKVLLSFNQTVDYYEVMMSAISRHAIKIVRLIIKMNIIQLNPMLLRACMIHSDVDICKLLIDGGANNYRQCLDQTDVLQCNYDIGVLLLKLIDDGHDQYAIAVFEGIDTENIEIIKILAPRLTPSTVDTLMRLAIPNNSDVVNALLPYSSKVYHKEYLALAITSRSHKVITLLI